MHANLFDRKETKYPLTEGYDGTQTVGTCVSIWKHDNKVSQSRSTKKSGINRHTGQRYYRWSFDGSAGFRRTSRGNVMPYAINAKKVALSTLPLLRQFQMHSEGASLPEHINEFFTEVTNHFGIKVVSDLYPVMKFYGLERRGMFSQSLLPMMRHTDYKDFVSHVYGKKNFRKDLVKAAAGTDLHSLTLTRPFRNDVPVDWVINFLRNNNAGLQFDEYMTQMSWDTWYKLIPMTTTNNRRSLLNEIWDGDTPREFQDTMRMVRMMNADRLQEFSQERYRSIHEMHDAITPYRQRYTAPVMENEDIEYKWDTIEWHNAEVEDMVVTLAQETDEMAAWGKEMRNCIASYRRHAVNGQGIYGAVHRNDKLIGNYEAKQGRLTQLLGKANSKMNEKDIEHLEKFFKERGLDVSNYWGKPVKVKINIEPAVQQFENVGIAAARAAAGIRNAMADIRVGDLV